MRRAPPNAPHARWSHAYQVWYWIQIGSMRFYGFEASLSVMGAEAKVR